ncbi:DNA cytosine methyltransferase [Salmonella enterica subsp. enterica serovar Hadar]|nr:DNA cytosine methyltransferase [Salmonella enterica subsp. enterica serovar Hadar]
MSKVKVLDTFAGAGGFSLGFHMAGAEIIVCNGDDS